MVVSLGYPCFWGTARYIISHVDILYAFLPIFLKIFCIFLVCTQQMVEERQCIKAFYSFLFIIKEVRIRNFVSLTQRSIQYLRECIWTASFMIHHLNILVKKTYLPQFASRTRLKLSLFGE